MRHWLTPNSHHWPFLSLNRQLELERMRQLALTRVFQRQESKGIKRAGETCSQYSYYLDAKDSGACQAKLIPLTHLRQPKSRIGAPKGPWLTPDPKPTLVGRLSFARGSVSLALRAFFSLFSLASSCSEHRFLSHQPVQFWYKQW